jgi:DnaJ-class molecular chaperone
MTGGEHFSVELTVSVEVPCSECGGRGYVARVGATGRRISDRTQSCLPCSGKGLIPENMPLSQFQALLASQAR